MSAEALLISIRARKTATWRRHEGTYKKARNVQIETFGRKLSLRMKPVSLKKLYFNSQYIQNGPTQTTKI